MWAQLFSIDLLDILMKPQVKELLNFLLEINIWFEETLLVTIKNLVPESTKLCKLPHIHKNTPIHVLPITDNKSLFR